MGTEAQPGAAPSTAASRPKPAISRRDILDIVRKHSDALPRPGINGSGSNGSMAATAAAASMAMGLGGVTDASSALMDGRYWQEMMDMYFVRGWEEGEAAGKDGKRKEALFDDMLFFVRQEKTAFNHILNFIGSFMGQQQQQQSLASVSSSSSAPAPSSSASATDTAEGQQEKTKPFFVRRWGPDLSRVVGSNSDEIDWRRSYYLNLICHSEYSLTVAICSRQALEQHRRSSTASVPPLFKVTKRVYASPSKARIDIDTSKAHETLPSFPDICFAIDDYDNTFEAVVLEDPDHCFCVLLNAHGGAAFPADDTVEKQLPDGSKRTLTRGTSSEAKALGEAKEGEPRITLFSGFVSYPMVRAAFQGGGTATFSFWKGAQVSKAEKLVMRGPGGRGEADVAVTGMTPPAQAGSDNSSPQKRGAAARHRQLDRSSSRDKGAADGKKGREEGKRREEVATVETDEERAFKLTELQSKLWCVQGELMALVQQQQQKRKQNAGLKKEEREAIEKENEERLKVLQDELKSVQDKLQKVQVNKGDQLPSPSPSPSLGGSSTGGKWSEEPEDPEEKMREEILKVVSSTPPKRLMVMEESENGEVKEAEKKKPQVLPLRCCLMSLSLPWDVLAFDLLFKEMPIKVDIGGRIFPPRRPSSVGY